jgi:hypothetical protein
MYVVQFKTDTLQRTKKTYRSVAVHGERNLPAFPQKIETSQQKKYKPRRLLLVHTEEKKTNRKGRIPIHI